MKMGNDEQKKEAALRGDWSWSDSTELVILPPYVEPEHRHLIEKAETALAEYSEYLLEKIKGELFKHGWNIKPHPSDVRKAEILFHEDSMRMLLVKQLANIKAMCERPRFQIRST